MAQELSKQAQITISIFENLSTNCQYYDKMTDGCDIFGSCRCTNCKNFIPK